jgi:glycosyltransferase involved in cell wall biosynthesis
MDILYLSSMCSKREQNEVFEKYGTITSYASQRFNHLFVEGLIGNGCRVTALTFEYLPGNAVVHRDSFIEIEDEIQYEYLPIGIGKIGLIRKAIERITSWCKEHKEGIVLCDIILGELSIALNLSNVGNCKKVAIVTDVPLNRANDSRKGIRLFPAYIKQKQIKYYDGYVFLTEQMNKDLNYKNKPYVIIEGFAKNVGSTVSTKYDKTCMMAGLLEDEFGVGLLLDAFTRMGIKDAKLIFYGKGSAVEKIKDYSRKDTRISYMGETTNQRIVEEEAKCTLLINPRPNKEKWTAYSFPSKNLEYISSGTPLVGFKLDGMPDDYIGHFYQIPNSGLDSFTELLYDLLTKDEVELREFGQNAKRWIIENKNPLIQGKKIVDLLEQI